MREAGLVGIWMMLLLPQLLHAQGKRFWVQFSDKQHTPFQIEAPEAYLSPKAIERRQRQGIAIDSSDLPVDPNYIAAVEALGVRMMHASKWLNGVTIFALDSNLITQVKQLPFVVDIDIVKKHHRDKTTFDKMALDTTKGFPVSGDIPGIYGKSYLQLALLNGQEMHASGFHGEGMTIAVLDAGFLNANTLPSMAHLFDNGQILGTKDFVSPGGNVFEAHTHGTAVLSTMASIIPGELIGTAHKANFWLIRSEDSGTEFIIEEDNWVVAAEFADSVGADIINSSLGYTTFQDSTQDHTYADMDGNTTRATLAADMAARKGILVFNSVGNSGTNSWRYLGAPSDGDSVIAVGAVSHTGVIAPFSSHGPAYDGRVKPNLCSVGWGAVIQASNGEIQEANGTSFASPILAGMAACLWQAHPEATNLEVKFALERSADRFNTPDTLYGYGIPDVIEAHRILSEHDPPNLGLERMPFIYPNPFTDDFQIQLFPNQTDELNVEIFDMLGQVIYEGVYPIERNRLLSLTIDALAQAPNGAYVVRLSTKWGSSTMKVVRSEPGVE